MKPRRLRLPSFKGPGLVVCLLVGLLLVVLMLIHDPNLVALNAATRGLGIAPPPSAAATTAPTTTTTTDPPAPATTSPPTTDPPTTAPRTTTTGAPTPTVAPPAPPTTAATPSVVTTTTQGYVPPHIASQTQPGSLGYPTPGVVSATYTVTTSGGVVSGTGTWSGTPDLSITVTCPGGATSSQQGPSGLSVSATCPSGSASVTIAESTGVESTVSYNLVISYPSN
ncbi:MAG TPA: hypothetical protein VHB02_18500 [Acidimicrobiales bacterium]|nr:hypothetical protein [Acidimicrobiales bacterium]